MLSFSSNYNFSLKRYVGTAMPAIAASLQTSKFKFSKKSISLINFANDIKMKTGGYLHFLAKPRFFQISTYFSIFNFYKFLLIIV